MSLLSAARAALRVYAAGAAVIVAQLLRRCLGGFVEPDPASHPSRTSRDEDAFTLRNRQGNLGPACGCTCAELIHNCSFGSKNLESVSFAFHAGWQGGITLGYGNTGAFY